MGKRQCSPVPSTLALPRLSFCPIASTHICLSASSYSKHTHMSFCLACLSVLYPLLSYTMCLCVWPTLFLSYSKHTHCNTLQHTTTPTLFLSYSKHTHMSFCPIPSAYVCGRGSMLPLRREKERERERESLCVPCLMSPPLTLTKTHT